MLCLQLPWVEKQVHAAQGHRQAMPTAVFAQGSGGKKKKHISILRGDGRPKLVYVTHDFVVDPHSCCHQDQETQLLSATVTRLIMRISDHPTVLQQMHGNEQ